MEKLEKLFANGPEWKYDGRVYHLSIIGFTVSLEAYEWNEPSGCKWKGANGRAWSGWVTREEALTWLRSRIIAHRDELNRITGLVPAQGGE